MSDEDRGRRRAPPLGSFLYALRHVCSLCFRCGFHYDESVNRMVVAAGTIVAIWSVSLPAQGRFSFDAALHTSDKSYLQATGEATISAKPEQALLEIGVIVQGPTPSAAAAQNAKQTDT